MSGGLLTLSEAARYVGMSRTTFRAMCAAGVGPRPFGKVGRYPRWATSVLDEWMRDGLELAS